MEENKVGTSVVELVQNTDKLSKLFNSVMYSGNQEMTVEVEKKFNIKQYETETVRASCKVNMTDISELDRMLAIAITSSDMEYTLYSEAVVKGLVSREEFARRSADIKSAIATIAGMVERISPESKMLNSFKESLINNNK